MHREVANKVSDVRQRQDDAHNKVTGVIEPNFQRADYVLVRSAGKVTNKLCFI